MPGLLKRNSRHVKLNAEAPRDSNPGTSPKSCRGARLSQTQYFKGMPRNGRSLGKRTSLPAAKLDGCLTDPEPDIDSGRATISNMRSKCRCSCVLQFTFRHAVGCVLHRPPSQVIHCTVLFLWLREVSRDRIEINSLLRFTSHHGEGLSSNPCQGGDTFAVEEQRSSASPRAVNGALHPGTDHRRARRAEIAPTLPDTV